MNPSAASSNTLPAYAASSRRMLDTRNGSFQIAEDGPADAPVLMLSNSLGTTLEMWDEQARHFSAHYRVLRYDTRGHGGSVISRGPYTFDQLGGDAIAILDALDLDRVIFCGISMGGHTGLWLAAHASERLHGVAVCNSAARIGSAESWQSRAESVRRGGVQTMRDLAASAPQRWFTAAFADSHPAQVAQAQSGLAVIEPEGYAACCEALAQSDLRSDLPRMAVPVLVVAGQHDPVTTLADAQAMHRELPQSELVSLPASHLSNIEAPAEFNRAMHAWLTTLVPEG